MQGPALLQAYLEAAQALGQSLIAGQMETFQESMTASAAALGPAYLAEMLQKSKTHTALSGVMTDVARRCTAHVQPHETSPVPTARQCKRRQ